jgi:hypothetical protein
MLADVLGDVSDLPCVLMHGGCPAALMRAACGTALGCYGGGRVRGADDADADALFASSSSLYASASASASASSASAASSGTAPAPAPVAVPGTRVVVDRVHSRVAGCDAMLVRVPSPDDAGSVAAHLARCASVLEVCKDAASSWCISMRRKVVVVHLVCRLPPATQLALAKVVEASTERTLFVLTCRLRSAIVPPLLSQAVCTRVRMPVPAPAHADGHADGRNDPSNANTPAAWSRAVAAGRATPRQAALASASASASASAARPDADAEETLAPMLQACAAAEHLAARLRLYGVTGDSCECREAMAERIWQVHLSSDASNQPPKPATQRSRRRRPSPPSRPKSDESTGV